MQKFTLILFLLIAVSFVSPAKDINAWKEESTMEQQFTVFKKNLNFWNGQYFMEPFQINQFYKALTDSMEIIETDLKESNDEIVALKKELSDNKVKTEDIKQQLDASLKRENSISVMGMSLNKSAYSITMYGIILAALVFAGIVFLMFKRSNAVTARTKKEYNELKEEFEEHKKNSLERYTKINTELHKTRMELKQK